MDWEYIGKIALLVVIALCMLGVVVSAFVGIWQSSLPMYAKCLFSSLLLCGVFCLVLFVWLEVAE